MKLYKLTDKKDQTKNATQWGTGITHTANGEGDLCGPGWLHAYEDPLPAVLHNPIHGAFIDPHLWEAEGAGEVLRDGQMKIGVTRLTTVKRIDLPTISTVQAIAYAILCGKAVCDNVEWNRWADRWLSGEDRSKASARAAVYAAWDAVYAAEYADQYAARSALYAASAANTAYAAEYAAQYAADASEYAARTGKPIDLVAIARKAMTYK